MGYYYYPFGLTMAGISDQALAFGKYNNYRYNGKEQQHKEFSDGSGLELYDYTYRYYDNQIGRFVGVDHLASKFPYYSPYQFAGNQVPNAIDLDGLEPLSFHSDQTPIMGADGKPIQDFTTYDDKLGGVTVHPLYDPGSGNNYFTTSDNSGNNYYWKNTEGESGFSNTDGNVNGSWEPYQTAEQLEAAAGQQIANGLDYGFATLLGGAIGGLEAGVVEGASSSGQTMFSLGGAADANSGSIGNLLNSGAGGGSGALQDATQVAQPQTSPSFVVTPNGEAIPVPEGATGPNAPQSGSGMVYQGGSGGNGMNSRTTGVRIMDANSNQGPRVNFMNANGQTVNPATGRTIPNSDPAGHIPLKPN
jgi:RHS repeat-associated protein